MVFCLRSCGVVYPAARPHEAESCGLVRSVADLICPLLHLLPTSPLDDVRRVEPSCQPAGQPQHAKGCFGPLHSKRDTHSRLRSHFAPTDLQYVATTSIQRSQISIAGLRRVPVGLSMMSCEADPARGPRTIAASCLVGSTTVTPVSIAVSSATIPRECAIPETTQRDYSPSNSPA